MRAYRLVLQGPGIRVNLAPIHVTLLALVVLLALFALGLFGFLVVARPETPAPPAVIQVREPPTRGS